jgi:two-component system cell cycle response regulator DivK
LRNIYEQISVGDLAVASNYTPQSDFHHSTSVDTQPIQPPTTYSIPKDTTVLVVEDNVSNFVLIARMLGYMGIHCEWKTSGYEVVEYADTLPRVDLVLMDIRLPYEDGYGALEKVRSSPNLKDTLVVAVTAEASQDQINKARTAGFDGFLGKPLDPDDFPDQIRRILSGESVWELGGSSA